MIIGRVLTTLLLHVISIEKKTLYKQLPETTLRIAFGTLPRIN